MKYLLLIATLVAATSEAQTILNFDKRFVQSEDKWVALKPGNDNAYPYGFIYIDAQAGLTFNYEGTFEILPTGSFVPKKLDASVKVRLEPNNVLVAFIPNSKFEELQISAFPEWLKTYKKDTSAIERLYRWGYMYNGWDECAKALTYLERAEKIDATFKGLAVELAYSYNCLNQFNKAEAILEKEIKTNAKDAYVNKEYIFTLIQNNKIDSAISQFELSVKTLKDTQYHAENCYNILHYFYTNQDKTNFTKWYRVLEKQSTENKMIMQNAETMKKEINKTK